MKITNAPIESVILHWCQVPLLRHLTYFVTEDMINYILFTEDIDLIY